MNSQILDASALRRKFVRLFAKEMKERVDYKFQEKFFKFLFVSFPLVFVIAVILLASIGVVVGEFILLPLTLYAITYVCSLTLLINNDIKETKLCISLILYCYTDMPEALRVSASAQWDDEPSRNVQTC